ncbi:MAG: RNA polymerase sigma factor [Verrucomicrobiota bacterium]
MNQIQAAEHHYDGLYRFALSLTKCEADAADIVQQTYLRWVKHQNQIRDMAKMKSWLFTTLYREFIRGLKKQSRLMYLEDEELEREMPATTQETGRAMDGKMAMEALQQVPPPFRAPLSLFYVQDFSYLEIAEVLNISKGTVMSRIYRGKQILKKLVESWESAPTLNVMRQADGS